MGYLVERENNRKDFLAFEGSKDGTVGWRWDSGFVRTVHSGSAELAMKMFLAPPPLQSIPVCPRS